MIGGIMRIILYSAITLFSSNLLAQEQESSSVVVKQEETKSDWVKNLNLNLGFSQINQKDVIGSNDGLSTTVNSKIAGLLLHKSDDNEWRNELTLDYAISRTPVIPDYYKSEDKFKISSAYFFGFGSFKNFGPYVRASLRTQLADGYDVQEDPETYVISKKGDEANARTVVTDDLKLTDAFAPLSLKETAGGFYKPVEEQLATLEFLLGLSAKQTFAADQLVLADNAATDEIEVVELVDQNEVGLDTKLAFKGNWNEKILYKLEGELFIPIHSKNEIEEDKDKSAFEKRSWLVESGVSFKFVKWASLDYIYRAERDYAISNEVQRTSSFLFNISYFLGDKDDPES